MDVVGINSDDQVTLICCFFFIHFWIFIWLLLCTVLAFGFSLMLFLVEGRSLDLPLDSYANNSYQPIIVLELSVSTVPVCYPYLWRVHDSTSKSCRRWQVFLQCFSIDLSLLLPTIN
jgi:hypothetical protein